ncbi:MSHA biogenesis protein MshI [Vibrio makurazakiensis]|uniref:MSHA biogenesis protein MshI n=1 Tax=Vibrio makurazakiensis TaxID=2910250 RepID=UPI003D13105F
MKLNNILDKLRPKKAENKPLTVMMQQSGLYLSASESAEHSSIAMTVPITAGDWEGALKTLLTSEVLNSPSLRVVLSSHYYQTYQIDKPEMPEEEWPVALPFLLKDLITERVTDIVADAIALPTANKLQVYVLPKKVLDKILTIAASSQMVLESIVPEDEVWGHSAGELGNFMLLQRSSKENFKIGAFVENTMCFQRTIRNVVPPLTGVASSGLQLDGLALELQRSIDYLSSQLKGAQLHQLKICCDEEDETELAEALNERLSSKVAKLIEDTRKESGNLIADLSASIDDFQINLYPKHLKPKKEYFTLTNIVASWVAMSVMLLISYGYIVYQQSHIDSKLASAQQELSQLNNELNENRAKLAKHKPSPEKIAAIARLKRDITSKKGALQAVAQYDDSDQIGYSGVMTALAKLGRNDISLSKIYMDNRTLDLSGYASSAGVVPNWVSQFQEDLNLVGRVFEELKISRNEDDVITFELYSQRGEK